MHSEASLIYAMAPTISVSLVTGLVASTSWVTQKNKITWRQSPRFSRVRKYFVTFRRRRREFRVFVVLLPCPRSILAKKSLFRTFTSCYYKPRLREARFWGRKWPRERHIFNNLLFLKPEWAIDSEAMRARGIIFCFSKIQLVGPKYRDKTSLASKNIVQLPFLA